MSWAVLMAASVLVLLYACYLERLLYLASQVRAIQSGYTTIEEDAHGTVLLNFVYMIIGSNGCWRVILLCFCFCMCNTTTVHADGSICTRAALCV